jgi:hypothetical protein
MHTAARFMFAKIESRQSRVERKALVFFPTLNKRLSMRTTEMAGRSSPTVRNCLDLTLAILEPRSFELYLRREADNREIDLGRNQNRVREPSANEQRTIVCSSVRFPRGVDGRTLCVQDANRAQDQGFGRAAATLTQPAISSCSILDIAAARIWSFDVSSA